jgi:AcrR family transcriptional regulator
MSSPQPNPAAPEHEPGASPGEPSPSPQLLWLRPERRTRQSRPVRSRGEIARAAIALADSEGFEAVTMRRVAAELGMATMSLYSHVASKDELIELAADELMAEIVLEQMPGHWREALTAIARRSREFFLRHPWVLSYTGESWPVGGPNLMHHVEQTLLAVSTLRLDRALRWDVAQAVDAYALGAAMDQVHDERELADSEPGGTGLSAERASFLEAMLATGDYPTLAAEDALGGRELWSAQDPEARFERGLGWLLDGIAAAEKAAADSGE